MLKSLLRRMFQTLGFDVHKISITARAIYDPFDVQKSLLNGLAITSPTILDVGSHQGESVQEYKAKFPQSMIYCFEPSPSALEILESRYRNNPQVRILPFAVGDRTGERPFYVNKFDATNSLFPRNTSTRRYYPSNAGPLSTITTQVTTIDEFVNSEKIATIDILKLDIQGGELMALTGAEQTLAKKSVPLIYAETFFVPHYEHSPLFYQLWDHLARFDYTVFNIYNSANASNGQLRFADVLFVNRQVRDEVIDKYPDEL